MQLRSTRFSNENDIVINIMMGRVLGETAWPKVNVQRINVADTSQEQVAVLEANNKLDSVSAIDFFFVGKRCVAVSSCVGADCFRERARGPLRVFIFKCVSSINLDRQYGHQQK